MPFEVLSGVPDTMTHAKFCINRLRGFWAAAPRKVPLLILFLTTLTTVLHYHADCDCTTSTLFQLVMVNERSASNRTFLGFHFVAQR